MKKFGATARVSAISLLLFGSGAIAQTEEDVRGLLVNWAPTQISMHDGIAEVILPQDRITDAIYYASISSGFCFGPLLDIGVNDVSELRILNKFGQQGWVFENEPGLCEQIVGEPASGVQVLIAAHSHLF